MEILRALDELAETIETARAMPMSSSVVVNRPHVLGLIQEAETLIPQEMREADRVLSERDEVLSAARDEAERLLTQASMERDRLLSEH